MANAADEPWDYTKEDGAARSELAVKAVRRIFQGMEWRAGTGRIHDLAMDAQRAAGPEDRGYTPEGKPAEQVLRRVVRQAAWKMNVKP